MNRKIRAACALLLVPLAVMLSSCREVPDVKPFADATAELKVTVSKGFDELQLRVEEYAKDDEVSNTLRTALKNRNKQLAQRWTSTDAALAAAVEYSDQIAALAAAGKNGEEAVGKVADSVNSLAAVFSSLSLPAAAVEVGKVLAAKAIEARAAKDIGDATDKAAEAVNAASKIIAENLADLKRLTDDVGGNYATDIYAHNQWLLQYYDALIEEQRLDARLLAAVVELNLIPKRACATLQKDKTGAEKINACMPNAAAFQESQRALREDQLKRLTEVDASFINVDVNTMGDLAKRRQSEVLKNSSLVQSELARIKPEVDKINGKIADITKRTEASKAVFEKASKAIAAWAKSHQGLANTLKTQKPQFSVREFAALVKEAADAAKQGGK